MGDHLVKLSSLSGTNLCDSGGLLSQLGGRFLLLNNLSSHISCRGGSGRGRRSTSDITLDGDGSDSSWVGGTRNRGGSSNIGGGGSDGAIFISYSLGNFILDEWNFVDHGNSFLGNDLNFFFKIRDFFLPPRDGSARGEFSDLLADSGDSLLQVADSFLDSLLVLDVVLDLALNDLNLLYFLSILDLLPVNFDVFLNDFKLFFLSLKRDFAGLLDLILLANLNVNGLFESLDFFFLDQEFLLFLEALDLLLDNLNFLSFLPSFFFLGANYDVGDGDLLLDLLLFDGSSLQVLSSISQLSSGS